MATPVSELTDLDYKILAYISKFDSASKEQIVRRIRGRAESIEFRLKAISEPDYHMVAPGIRHPIDGTNYIEEEFEAVESESEPTTYISKESYCITPFGLKALEDYLYSKRETSRKIRFWTAYHVATLLIAVAAPANSVLLRIGL